MVVAAGNKSYVAPCRELLSSLLADQLFDEGLKSVSKVLVSFMNRRARVLCKRIPQR